MGTQSLTESVFAAARAEGFDYCAAAPVTALGAADRLRDWLAAEMHGTMAWLERDPARRADPSRVVPDARTVLVVARNYFTDAEVASDPRAACISRYAWGDEYHDVMGAAVRRLYTQIQELAPGASGRYYVDTGPVMEKAWAEVAGLGWIGKHTNVVRRGAGSWFFLGALILDCELEYGAPARDHCGSCAACIDACPTAAIVAPYVLDARRCISYLTIESRGPIPIEFRAAIGNRVFGCDDCQDVCPWNRFAQSSADALPFYPREGNRAAPLHELFAMDLDEFRRRFRRSPVKRAKFEGFRRNLAVALGNSGDATAVAPLASALDRDSALVRGHCAWALGELGGPDACTALRRALVTEQDEWVRAEIASALVRVEDDGRTTVAS
jgi:epoxyqueuosine reductase